MTPIKPVVLTAAKALAIILASAVALFALRLFIAGVPLTVVAEVPEGTQQLSGVVNANYMPYLIVVNPPIVCQQTGVSSIGLDAGRR
jgi:hypothetical protein